MTVYPNFALYAISLIHSLMGRLFATSLSSSSSSPSPSPSDEFRILQVTIEPVRLTKEESEWSWMRKKKAKIYSKVYIQPNTKLRTPVNDVGHLLFGVTEDFLYDVQSILKVEVYRVRRLLKDALLATAECSVQGVLGPENNRRKDLRWEGQVPLVLSSGRSKKGEPQGVVKVGLEVWRKGAFKVVGGCDGLNWAMEHGELFDNGDDERRRRREEEAEDKDDDADADDGYLDYFRFDLESGHSF